MPDLSTRTEHERQLAAAYMLLFQQTAAAAPDPATIDWEAFAAKAARLPVDFLAAVYVDAAKTLARQAIGPLHAEIEVDRPGLEEEAYRWAREHSATLGGQIAINTRRMVATELARPDEAVGLEVPGTGQALLVATALGADRADAIATTEVTRAITAGEMGFAQSARIMHGLHLDPIWRCDMVPCEEFCAPLEGKGVAVWSLTYPNGPPGHPNCRCWLEWRRRATDTTEDVDDSGHWVTIERFGSQSLDDLRIDQPLSAEETAHKWPKAADTTEAEWDEDKHPRDHGKFASAASEKADAASAKSKASGTWQDHEAAANAHYDAADAHGDARPYAPTEKEYLAHVASAGEHATKAGEHTREAERIGGDSVYQSANPDKGYHAKPDFKGESSADMIAQAHAEGWDQERWRREVANFIERDGLDSLVKNYDTLNEKASDWERAHANSPFSEDRVGQLLREHWANPKKLADEFHAHTQQEAAENPAKAAASAAKWRSNQTTDEADTREGHQIAAAAHQKAADEYRKAGNEAQALKHEKRVKFHTREAKRFTDDDA